jgi:hypothetical protein
MKKAIDKRISDLTKHPFSEATKKLRTEIQALEHRNARDGMLSSGAHFKELNMLYIQRAQISIDSVNEAFIKVCFDNPLPFYVKDEDISFIFEKLISPIIENSIKEIQQNIEKNNINGPNLKTISIRLCSEFRHRINDYMQHKISELSLTSSYFKFTKKLHKWIINFCDEIFNRKFVTLICLLLGGVATYIGSHMDKLLVFLKSL